MPNVEHCAICVGCWVDQQHALRARDRRAARIVRRALRGSRIGNEIVASIMKKRRPHA